MSPCTVPPSPPTPLKLERSSSVPPWLVYLETQKLALLLMNVNHTSDLLLFVNCSWSALFTLPALPCPALHCLPAARQVKSTGWEERVYELHTGLNSLIVVVVLLLIPAHPRRHPSHAPDAAPSPSFDMSSSRGCLSAMRLMLPTKARGTFQAPTPGVNKEGGAT